MTIADFKNPDIHLDLTNPNFFLNPSVLGAKF
jgi:hypothetical protein